MNSTVVVVGAGPTGLAVALGLQLQGIQTLVIEAEPALTRDLRAGSFHPPTLEVLDTLGVGQKFRDIGIVVPQWQIRDRKEGVVAQFDLGLLEDETPYPYRLHCEQFKLTPILYDALLAAGGEVRFSTPITGFTQDDDAVVAEADAPEGRQRFACRYLVGADGGRSVVRKAMGVAFEGFTWPERFLVVSMTEDLSRHGYTGNAYIADPVEWVAIFVMPHLGPPGLWRVVFPTDPNVPEEVVTSAAFCQERLTAFHPQGAPFEIPYVGTYRVHQRVAADFRLGRVLLAGDAAHVNNPLGAMGLNSGLHDAGNLVEKLGRVIKGADVGLLDRYVRQRRTTNIEYVQAISIRNKQLLEERDPEVRRRHLDDLRALAADKVRAKEHLMRSSMIASVRRAAAIE